MAEAVELNGLHSPADGANAQPAPAESKAEAARIFEAFGYHGIQHHYACCVLNLRRTETLMEALETNISLDLEKLRPKLRFRVGFELGFACPDCDDVVQETLRRYLDSVKTERLRNPEAAGAFVNGICRNVILEYRRRILRDVPMPEIIPEPPANRIREPELLELRDAISMAMQELSARDRQILQLFFLEERSPAEIVQTMHLSEANFRVVLCRAKERFRQIYRDSCNKNARAAT